MFKSVSSLQNKSRSTRYKERLDKWKIKDDDDDNSGTWCNGCTYVCNDE